MTKPKIYCPSCNLYTYHIFHSEFRPEPIVNIEIDITEINEYYIVQCQGCRETGFLHRFGSNVQEEDEMFEYRYPEGLEFENDSQFLQLNEQNELPNIIYNIYQELIIAFKYEINILCSVAIRMVIEGVCMNRKISGDNLKSKISNLLSQGHISQNEFEIIDKLREIGNEGAHKLKTPSISDIYAALEATNHLLRTIYVVQKRTKRLRIKK